MNKNNEICIGMVGAGRASELHLDALKRFSHIPFYLKKIVAKRQSQMQFVKNKYHFESYSFNFNDLIEDDQIDVIDICTPPYVHKEMIIKALKAEKHVICQKPLTGYFGSDSDITSVGKNISKKHMYQCLLKDLQQIRYVVNNSSGKFMYAENFIYAPAVRKSAEILKNKKSRILFAKGQESLKGSSSTVAGEWNKTGGGTFIRTGCHPLSAILYLKNIQAKSHNQQIYVKSVIADMNQITSTLSQYQHRHINAHPNDVQDCGTAIITFSDNTKALIIATDVLLGGSKNYIQLYCNDAVINCNITMFNAMNTYFLDNENLTNLYLSQMLPTNVGWNNTFLQDSIMRGYVDEMNDFLQCIYYNRQPLSNFEIAYNSIKVIYAAYKSAQIGKIVYL